MRRALSTLALVASLAACATAGQSGSSGQRRNPDVITAEEIQQANVQNAWEAVSRLRPTFLATHGGTSSSHALRVIVDDVPRGYVGDVLPGIRADNVQEIRYVSASDATMRWGTGYTGGAIVVKTVAGGR